MISCFFNISQQIEQWTPSDKPVSIHVAGYPLSVTGICAAGITSCAVILFPQAEQCDPSVNPVVVQVAGYPKSVIHRQALPHFGHIKSYKLKRISFLLA